MPRNPNEITERYVANIKRDVNVLERIKDQVSSKTISILDELIMQYKQEVYSIYMRSNMLPPAWCKE